VSSWQRIPLIPVRNIGEKRAQKVRIFAHIWSTFVNFCQFLCISGQFLLTFYRFFLTYLTQIIQSNPPTRVLDSKTRLFLEILRI